MNSTGILKSAVRLRSSFVDGVGKETIVNGTGFFILMEPEESFCLVTNLHLVDARLVKGEKTDLMLTSVEVMFRSKADHLQLSETKFIAIKNPKKFWTLGSEKSLIDGSDVAIYHNPEFTESPDGNFIDAISESDLASHEYFFDCVRPMDQISFVGFPGSNGQKWWDTKLELAVSRPGWISSLTDGYFSNDAILTSNVVLVSGLSFSGSSGSIVVFHPKTMSKFKDGVMEEEPVEAKVIGIMSGHFDGGQNMHNVSQHSGLSYFTRSSSIQEILSYIRSSHGGN